MFSSRSRCARAVTAVACLITTPVAGDTIVASDPRVQWIGRTAPGANGTVLIDWVGTGARVSASGGSYIAAVVRMPAHTTTRLRLAAWQWDQGAYEPESVSWVLPALGLPSPGSNGTVDIAVPFAGGGALGSTFFGTHVPPQYWASTSLTVVGFVSDGVFSDPGAPFTRGIEFIGDSITAATNVHAHVPCGDGGFESDYAVSWSSLVCRNFTTNCSTVAVGGKGLIRNCGGGGPTMTDYFTQALYANASVKYGFGSLGYRPDVIVVNLGTNDYGCGANASALDGPFSSAYVALMDNATAWYAAQPGDIVFFASVGPMTNAYLNGTLMAISEATQKGHRVQLLDLMGAPTDGCAGHPGVQGHFQMAQRAQAAIAAAMGW